jgi:2,3,4,5-tetrahydropyridine-2-carboxylate N-succinyltransferase
MSTGASATGIATVTTDGTVLDVWFPAPALTDEASTGTTELGQPPAELAALVGSDDARGVRRVAVRTEITDLADAPVDVHDVWLRLHLLSHRLVAPHWSTPRW